MFLAPDFFGAGPPEFLDLHYSIQPVSDHVAKFQGRGTSENAWRNKKKEKTSLAFYKSSRTTVTGGLTTPSTLGEKKFGELWSTNKNVLVAHIDPPMRTFFGRLHFGPWGVLVPQIFTCVTN